jgi:hypothetical protein
MVAQISNADIFGRSSLQHYIVYVTRYALLLSHRKLMCLCSLFRRGVLTFVVSGLHFQVCSRSSLFLRPFTISQAHASGLLW